MVINLFLRKLDEEYGEEESEEGKQEEEKTVLPNDPKDEKVVVETDAQRK